jgi:two-component system response regulator (stage 0 sporulation protein A)
MSNKVKIFIGESDADKIGTLEKAIAGYPEFELHIQPVTAAARVVGEFATNNTNMLAKRISDIFITVGIPAHIKGYQFLREAIKLTIEQPGIINCITKQLYPSVAKRFNTSPSKVERAIRHAIEVGWSRGKIENINNIFGVKVYGQHDRPTNGEFIALVADKMLIDGVC